MDLCKCGCGQKMDNPKNNYIHGHNRKGLPSHTSGNKWSINYDRCVNCNTDELSHAGKGLCKICYKKYFYQLKKSNIGAWAQEYNECIDCGRIDRPHKANGRCGTCHVNNLNRKKGIKKRNFGAWSWYYDSCVVCGTIEKKHVKDGLCYDCHEESKRDLENGYEICPVCEVKVKKLNQHLSMKSKNCEDHKKYQYDLFKQYFDSDLGLDDISKELNGMDRHAITRQFKKLFGSKATTKRNQAVKSCLCSERAKIGFNHKNRFGKVVYYNSLNNGKVRLRSKIEKRYAEFLDESGVKWFYEYKSFPYVDKKGKRRTYTPDFYLVDEDKYVEVKGYEKNNDLYKLNYLKNNGINIEMVKEI